MFARGTFARPRHHRRDKLANRLAAPQNGSLFGNEFRVRGEPARDRAGVMTIVGLGETPSRRGDRLLDLLLGRYARGRLLARGSDLEITAGRRPRRRLATIVRLLLILRQRNSRQREAEHEDWPGSRIHQSVSYQTKAESRKRKAGRVPLPALP